MFSFASHARGETSPYCLAESLESTRTVSIRFVQHAILSNTTASAHDRKRLCIKKLENVQRSLVLLCHYHRTEGNSLEIVLLSNFF